MLSAILRAQIALVDTLKCLVIIIQSPKAFRLKFLVCNSFDAVGTKLSKLSTPTGKCRKCLCLLGRIQGQENVPP